VDEQEMDVQYDMDGNPIMEEGMEDMDPYGDEMDEVERQPYDMEADDGQTEDDLKYEEFANLIDHQEEEGQD
jgi:hypothetical protein